MFNSRPLMIDTDSFISKIELVEENKDYAIHFKIDCYDRALKVLKRRLIDLKDDVWVVAK